MEDIKELNITKFLFSELNHENKNVDYNILPKYQCKINFILLFLYLVNKSKIVITFMNFPLAYLK